MHRDLLAHKAIAEIPKMLTLLDRNPHSPTYGCFDRNYWHYRVIDFPSGMAQELVWPLALAYDTNLADNPYYRQPVIREWAEAGIRYAARSAHHDGSCDDYYPFERALGAAAFSFLACVESYTLLGMNDPLVVQFLERRAEWLAHHDETGRLANHQALVILCLELISLLLDTRRWDNLIDERLQKLLSWQSAEGWFSEYEGFDPGYHTLAISVLSRVFQLRSDNNLQTALERAVRLAAEFMHPDGSYGGEYGSRNTYGYFPHGFELVGAWMPEALSINDRFLNGLAKGREACFSDDHIIGHHAWNFLLAWRDYLADRPVAPPRPGGRHWLSEAGILVDRRQGTELYIALNKGGVFKMFQDNTLIASDTQISLQVRTGGRIKNAVAHLIDDYQVQIDEDRISVQGTLGWAKHRQMNVTSLMLLRIAMITLGRFSPNLVRRLLQSMLIIGKKSAPFSFRRTFKWQEDGWQVVDEIMSDSWSDVVAAGIGCSQTSIYIAMSRTYQVGQLGGWLDLTGAVHDLVAGQPLRIERRLRQDPP